MDRWNRLDPQERGAIIGGAAVIIAAIVGGVFVSRGGATQPQGLAHSDSVQITTPGFLSPTIVPATIATDRASTPFPTLAATPTSLPSPTAFAQHLSWGPDSDLDPGVCIDLCVEFIAWPEVKEEVEFGLLPRMYQVPPGSSLELQDLAGNRNRVVAVIDATGSRVGSAWFGRNPELGWDPDGMLRIGTDIPTLEVWAAFQRFSDGSYRRLK